MAIALTPPRRRPGAGRPSPDWEARRWAARRHTKEVGNDENWRDVLCLGESTAESGPRCGEAEEAKRRPAFSLGLACAAAVRRFQAPGARRPAPFPIDPKAPARLPSLARSRRLDILC